ncbi:MAG: VCBS repeat-containing protein, partial [Verrucomicrobiae bacterium]|nr:VCBS repeat-containing protein [Verrucomicrobiae bacterium]
MRSLLPLTAVLSLGAVGSLVAQGSIAFDDVTSQAGVSGGGPTFGAGSWTDFDGDGWPDLWVGNHANTPQLWINQGDGTFVDLVPLVWSGLPKADTHGAMWADFDHDGDPDLLEMVGADSGNGSGPNQLWRNDGGILVEQAADLGLDFALGRGRM